MIGEKCGAKASGEPALCFWLNRGHRCNQRGVVGAPISAKMNASMTIGAQSDHVCGMIGTSITEPAQMMRFKVWVSI